MTYRIKEDCYWEHKRKGGWFGSKIKIVSDPKQKYEGGLKNGPGDL
jgi:hypothetical protein